MADPGRYDIDIYERTDVIETFTCYSDTAHTTIFSLVGYSVKAVAVDEAENAIPAGTFDFEPALVGDGSGGQIAIAKTAADVAAALFNPDAGGESPKWDLILTHIATAVVLPPILQGSVRIHEVYTP